KKVILENEINIKKLMYLFSIFGFLLAFIYLVNLDLFVYLKLLWNKYDMLTDLYGKYGNTLSYRYGFIWSDPNNPAYAFASVSFFILLFYKPNNFIKILLIFNAFFIATVSMSAGATLSIFI